MAPRLSDAGIVVHDTMRFTKYIKDSADTVRQREMTGTLYEQFGWKDRGTAFLYGTRLYGSRNEPPALSNELRDRARFLTPAPGGSLDAWKQAMDNMMGKGSEGMSFIALASFGSVLMSFLDRTEGGCVIQFVTPDSGKGKSTALSGALSVWSTDKRGLELTTVDTRTSKMVAMSLLCNLPAIYDEFVSKDPAIVREMMTTYMIGRDRMRSDVHGHLVTQSTATWTNLLLAAGNRSMSDTIRSDNDTDAPTMRIMEIPVESSGDMSQSDLIRRAEVLSANGGYAGDAFLRYLMIPGVLEWTRENLLTAIDNIMIKARFKREHRFWARALASVQIAAFIVEKAGIITFSAERITDWAIGVFGEKAEAPKPAFTMIPALSQYINDHQGELLHMPSAGKPGRVLMPIIGDKPRNKVNIRVDDDTKLTWIALTPFRKWMEMNAAGSFTFLMDELKAIGALKESYVQRTLTACSGMQGGLVACVCIDMANPMISGVLREVNEVSRKEQVAHKLERL